MTLHLERLTGVDPVIVTAVTDVIIPTMAAMGHPVFVVEGVRSLARQRELWAQGRTKPGKVVTWVNGDDVTACRHLMQADGLGHAVDLAFQAEDPWESGHPWAVLGAVGSYLGLRWGGTWTRRDNPHFETR